MKEINYMTGQGTPPAVETLTLSPLEQSTLVAGDTPDAAKHDSA
jgi:hypothetical protein